MESSILSRIFSKRCDEKNSSEVPSPIQVKEDIDMRLSERNSLNRLCDIRDWEVGGTLCQIMSSLNEGSYIHRKSWEYAMCIYGLESLGVVTPESHAIAVGAGYERPLFYFANRINRMVATDLYSNPGLEGDPNMLTSPEKFAPFPYQKDHLEVLRMDGTDLRFDDNSFDFAFSLSSIEHFGSRDNVEKAMSEMFRVLKPNGILCLATELILNNAHHPEYFTLDELKKHIIESTELKLVGGDIDFRISKSLYLNPIDLDVEKDLNISPHIVLKKGDVIWTSIILFFKKEPINNSLYQVDHLERMKKDSMTNREYYQRIMAIRYPIYLNLIKKYKVQGELLDVGCGFSEVFFRDYVLPAGFRYYCTDVSQEVINCMATLTQTQGEDRYAAVGTLESLPWENDSFDVVYACHILEHTTDISKAFSEIKRVLKPNGILLFGVPCGYDDEPAHLHNRELDEWMEDFRNNRWEILEWGQFDFNNNEFYGVARPISNIHLSVVAGDANVVPQSIPQYQLDLFREACNFIEAYTAAGYINPLGQRCLDVGCGIGNMVLALKRYGAQSVVGIDISLNVLGTSEIDKIACLENIDLNECELIEGEIGVYPLGKGSFDLITLFNVIEHVERPFDLLANLHDLLREGGILCISSAPLFYSPIGHHCWHIFPRETHPWIHLIDHNFLDILKEKDLRAANFYLGLNKITSSEILNIIRTIGFRIKKQDLYLALEKIEDHPENYKIFKSVAPNFEDLTIEGINLILEK